MPPLSSSAVRRAARIGARTLAIAACSASVLTTQASAYGGPGSLDMNPNAWFGTPSLVYPGTTTTADAWKLLGGDHSIDPVPDGKGPGGIYETSGQVQIAPRWIIGARHSSLRAGDNFVTQSGDNVPIAEAYTLQQEAQPDRDVTPRAKDGGIDITIGYLSRPVAAPAGGFPRLLSEHVGPDLDSALPGYVLHAGLGGATAYPSPIAGWTKPNGLNVPNGRRVWLVNGDSGSVDFWYPSAGSRPVIMSVTESASSGAVGFGRDGNFALPLAQTQTSSSPEPLYATVGDWMRATFAKHPQSQTGVADPEWTTLAGLGIDTASLVPAAPRNVTLATDNDQTLIARWAPGSGSPVAPTGYRVTLSPGGQTQTVDASARTASFPGATKGITYTATVTAFNANGDARPAGTIGPVSLVTDPNTGPSDTPITEPASASVMVTDPPTAISDARVDKVEPVLTPSGTGFTITYCATVSWAPATLGTGAPAPTYAGYFGGNEVAFSAPGTAQPYTISGSTQTRFSLHFCTLRPGSTNLLLAWAVDGDMTSTPVAIYIPVPTGPASGTTVNMTGLSATTRRVVDSSGAVDYCATLSWDAFPGIGGYTQAATYKANPMDGDDIITSTSVGSDHVFTRCGLRAGGNYMFYVFAGYAGLDGTASARLKVTLPTGPAAGTVLPAPTGFTLTPTKKTTSGGTDYCVTASWNAPTGVDGLAPATVSLDFLSLGTDQLNLSWPAGSAPTSKEICGLQPGKFTVANVTATYQVNDTDTYDATTGATTHTLT